MPAFVAIARPRRMYPACAIELYAIKRLMLDCPIAAILPIVIVKTAIMDKVSSHAGITLWKSDKTLIKTAKPAAFDTTERNAATEYGAP